MLLALAATEIEMSPLQRLMQGDDARIRLFVTGVGPVETAVRLTRFLHMHHDVISAVVNFGVAGGYLPVSSEVRPEILDLFFAESEVFGDTGVCYPDRIEPLPADLSGKISFVMDRFLLQQALRICADRGIRVQTGNFVTVAGVSATLARGEILSGRFQAQCESMEGAAVARVCAEYSLPVLEMRCISNLVEDRDLSRWRLQEACERAAKAAAEILKNL